MVVFEKRILAQEQWQETDHTLTEIRILLRFGVSSFIPRRLDQKLAMLGASRE